jgi:acid stress-induced BolA-like protein IbaG/YrbA
MVTPEDVKQWIEEALSDSSAEVVGDGRHFEAVVVCPQFDGKSMLEQHRMVYGGLGNRMDDAIHALSLRTYTPEQWNSNTA